MCLIGGVEFTDEQYLSLTNLIADWQQRYPGAEVVGHRDLDGRKKTCPNFEMSVAMS